MHSNNITISLVSHNQIHDLKRLLPSLQAATNICDAEILLVNNTPEDDVDAYIRDCYPGIRITDNDHRMGYGQNHNINLSLASGRYFVVMNVDITVEHDVFSCLSDYLDKDPTVGIVSPKILNEDGTIQGLNKRYPTIFDLFLRRFVPPFVQRHFQQRLDHYEMRDVGYDHEYDVPFLSGAFMFCRTDLMRFLHGFDIDFFLYFEDVDLCRRVQRTHRTVYYPGVSITHFWRRRAQIRWIYTYYFCRSASRYFHKWGYKLF
ncbi:MAG: glycosyltransferase [Syntrophales bacterium]